MAVKVLNLYAGIGGNRKLWTNVEVTAIEIDPHIASIYRKHFPNDRVFVIDAHDFLLNNYDQYDFIWSSPPCPSHSRVRNIAGVGRGQNKPIYPDMKLYEEIIFLNQVYHSSGCDFDGSFVVENVRSYYDPLIKPQIIGRHYMWANFFITSFHHNMSEVDDTIGYLQTIKGFNVNDITLLRNCVLPELGLHVFNCAFKQTQQTLSEVMR
jgi:DNA (cytosine-5)-methyltransferase 1